MPGIIHVVVTATCKRPHHTGGAALKVILPEEGGDIANTYTISPMALAAELRMAAILVR